MDSNESREKVAVVKYDGTINSFAKALTACDGFNGIRPNDKILLKPNILWGGIKPWPPYGVVTTSTMVGYVLQALRDRGCTNITVGEGTIPNKELGSTTTQGFEWSGIGKIARKYGARLVDFNTEPFEDITLENVGIKISRWALDSDFIINLPVLKAHRHTKVSLGMKNLKGFLALKSKQRFHKHNLDRLIAQLNMNIKPSLTIIDGIYGLERGPDFLGTPRRMDLIIAGKDVFSCDIVGAMVMGFQPDDVEYLRQFASLTGRTVSQDIEIIGESIDQLVQKFEWQFSAENFFHQAGISGITIQDGSNSCCSGCLTILSALTAVLTKDGPDTALDGVEICIGSEGKAKEESHNVILLGDCSISKNKGHRDAIPIKGCPPPVMDSVMAMVLKCYPRKKAAKILMSRLIKQLGTKLGIFHETYPVFGVFKPPEFNEKHF